ncbi:Hypothetical_protein [Hexamita inflata]|uniref:Hypothetical_protein n=1 Tax=Hexamita inflata TaxID=28002 RepID=A0AA86QGF9_9EUKA|nr:Hypothetical protein HINF_LOCUS43901 [Hexamita inflata]
MTFNDQMQSLPLCYQQIELYQSNSQIIKPISCQIKLVVYSLAFKIQALILLHDLSVKVVNFQTSKFCIFVLFKINNLSQALSGTRLAIIHVYLKIDLKCLMNRNLSFSFFL